MTVGQNVILYLNFIHFFCWVWKLWSRTYTVAVDHFSEFFFFLYPWTFALPIHSQSFHHKMHHGLWINIQNLCLILRAFLFQSLDSAVIREIKYITEHTRAHTPSVTQRISPFVPSHAWKVHRLWPESSAVRSDVMFQAGHQANIKWIRYKSEMLDKGAMTWQLFPSDIL